MRILLINPPRSPQNAILEAADDETRPLIHRKLIGPPLGLLSVAAAVREHAPALLELKAELDLRPEGPSPAELLRRELRRLDPQLVGVTVIASELPASLELLAEVKRLCPGALTIAGGLHAQLCPGDLDHPAVDLVYRRQDAGGFAELVRTLERGGDPAEVPGLLVRRDGALRDSGPPPACDPAGAAYVTPWRELLRPWHASYLVGDAPPPVTYLTTSFGCPCRCSFCSIWPGFGGQYHQRPVEAVLAELAGLGEYSVVRLADANTTADVPHARRLFAEVERAGLARSMVADMRADTAAEHPELVEQMARAGVKVVICGFESFREEELDRYGKGLGPDAIGRAVAIFHHHGIRVRGNYLVRPEYGPEDFAALGRFAGRHRVGLAGYTVLTPMPGTPLHRQLRGEIVDHDLSRYNFFNCVLRTRLPLHRFHQEVAGLWRVRLGRETV